MAFSGYKNQRRRTGKGGENDITEKPLEKQNRGKNRKKLSFLCFFSKKQRRPRREATSSGGRKQLAHQSSITSPFPCLQRGSNTGNTTRRKNRNCTEGSKFSAPVSSLRNRGVRASRSWGTNAWRKAILWLYKQEKATEKKRKTGRTKRRKKKAESRLNGEKKTREQKEEDRKNRRASSARNLKRGEKTGREPRTRREHRRNWTEKGTNNTKKKKKEQRNREGEKKQRNDTETRISPTIVFVPSSQNWRWQNIKTRRKGDANSTQPTKAQRQEPALTIVFTVFSNQPPDTIETGRKRGGRRHRPARANRSSPSSSSLPRSCTRSWMVQTQDLQTSLMWFQAPALVASWMLC